MCLQLVPQNFMGYKEQGASSVICQLFIFYNWDAGIPQGRQIVEKYFG